MADEIRIIHAIQGINPSAKVNVWDNDIDRIDWEISTTNEETGLVEIVNTTPIATEDILAKQIALQAAFDAARTKKAVDKASGIAKLEALGLTAAEIKAVIGG